MWEQIASNKRKSMILVLVMAAVLFGLGFVIAEASAPGAGVFGIMIAFVIWVIMSLVAYFKGDNILLAVSGAKKIEKQDHPELWNVVEEMTIASGLPKMPDVYLIDDMSLNAFAVGRKPEKAAVAVTAGLLAHLNRDELQGVIAHEVSHIINRDVLLMTMVGIMLGAVVMISEIYLRSLWYGGHGRARFSGRSRGGKGGGQGIAIVIAIVAAILAPLLAQLIYFAVSRRREYLADANGAILTRYPEGLASALEQLGKSHEPVAKANKATAAMYIVNPFAKAKLAEITSTHPPIQERVKILRSIGGTATYGAYQAAWNRVDGSKAGQLPGSALQDTTHGGTVREADPRAAQGTVRSRMRGAGDALRNINKFVFLPCVCGLKLKIPPDYKHDKVDCPKCQRELRVPVAELAAAAAIADHLPEALGGRAGAAGLVARAPHPRSAEITPTGRKVVAAAPLTIKRTPGEWMTFKCTCGTSKTLSPGFDATRTQCGNCGRTIEIE